MTLLLAGRVVALIGAGTDSDRALAVACAEAGADIALATLEPGQQQEFATNSIANEIWAIGREHFVRVMDSADPAAVAAFADEVWDRLGRCDVLLATHSRSSTVPFYELSPSEWSASLAANLTSPFLAMQAFARLMERQGSGLIIFTAPEPAEGDASIFAARAALNAAALAANAQLLPFGVTVSDIPAVTPTALVAMLS